MLYIFSSGLGNVQVGDSVLHAGGLVHCIETVEELAHLEDKVDYRKAGVFYSNTEEWMAPVEYRISDVLLADGIDWDWFRPGARFGNRITCYRVQAFPEYKTVVYGTDLSLDEYLMRHGPSVTPVLERKHVRHDGWLKYESRWPPGMCPQEAHAVSLTWIVTTHKLPEFAYERIRSLIEDKAEPLYPEMYSTEPGKHFSVVREFNALP
jgi:hypothetical protein